MDASGLIRNAGAALQGSGEAGGLLLAGVAFGIVGFSGGLSAWRRLRWVEDTPTSKVRSMALGRVELHGRSEEKAPLRAPFSGLPCVWYRYLLEERVGSGRRRRWRRLAAGDSAAWPFYLEDDTGRVLVDPREARVDVARGLRETNPPLAGPIAQFLSEHGIEARRWFARRTLRFSEWRIAPGSPLYVLGVAHERADLLHERRQRIGEKLAALKRDPEAMAHLDSDGDGQVSGEEWEVARRLAVDSVERQGFEDRVVLGRGPERSPPFLIADRAEPSLLRWLRWRALGGVYGGGALSLVCLAVLLGRLGLLGGD